MSLTIGHDAGEQQGAEHLLEGGLVGEFQALLHRVAERLPDLVLAEPVTHQVAGLDHELLALVTLFALVSSL